MEHNELKPCPFCGGEAEIVVKEARYGINGAWVRCKNCKGSTNLMCITEIIIEGMTVSTPITDNSKQDGINKAVEAWNRRANNGT